MNNREYWRRREEEALKHYITEEKEYDKQVKRIYQNMMDSCQSQINAFYGRYADKEGITLAEAKKRVSKLDIAAYERKAKRYVEEKNFSARANEEMRLYNLTMKVNRLEMLKANLGLELIAGHDELDRFMGGILQGRTMDELKRQAGILGKTVKSNTKKADAIVNASFHNATFSDRVWMYQDLLKSELSKLLQSGIIQGENPRALARALKSKFGASTFSAERLMRTELARVQTEAQKQSFERNGFVEYEFIANSGCCDICQGLNGKHFKVAKMMPGENASPMHPHCRCSAAAYEDSDEYEAWLDYLDKGGSTAEWNQSGKTARANSSTLLAKSGDSGILNEKEEAAVLAYVSGGSYMLNAKLRDGIPLKPHEEELAAALDRALEKMPVYKGQVVRSLVFHDAESARQFVLQHSEGKSVVYPAFTSASVNPGYHEQPTVLMHIDSKSGRDIRRYNEAEAEVLFPRNTRFFIDEVSVDDGVARLKVREQDGIDI